jgi:UDP-glucose 4-epimerase
MCALDDPSACVPDHGSGKLQSMIDNQLAGGAVLVTGGAGFIGSYVVRDLLARGDRVVVYDLLTAGNALSSVLVDRPTDGSLVLAHGTVLDGWRLRHLCEVHGVDRIVHLASPLTQDVTENPLGGVRDVCEGTATVFEVAHSCGVRRVVWASSVSVFGLKRDYPAGPVANEAAHLPVSLYGSCKSLCEQMARTYRDERGLDSIALRLSVVFGAGRLRGYMSFPSDVIRRAANGEAIEVPIADQQINWQYVGTVAELVIHSLAVPAPRNLAFNTPGDVRTFREVGEVLQSLAPGLPIDYRDDPVDEGQQALREFPSEYDDAELRRELGYAPSFTFERGIRETFMAFKTVEDGSLVSR